MCVRHIPREKGGGERKRKGDGQRKKKHKWAFPLVNFN